MAEVATKKSMNVVSTTKSEVCSVRSNNGLIDLDNITTSNDPLMSLCENYDDDDLVLSKNTRNELESEDKSLQELIESELALRICSNTDHDVVGDTEEQEEESTVQPEPVKRIVLDAGSDLLHSIDEPYTYQNGHDSPESNIESRSTFVNVDERIVEEKSTSSTTAAFSCFQSEVETTESTELTEFTETTQLTDLTEQFLLSERHETTRELFEPETIACEIDRSTSDRREVLAQREGRLSGDIETSTGVDLLSSPIDDARDRFDDETEAVQVESPLVNPLDEHQKEEEPGNVDAQTDNLLIDVQSEETGRLEEDLRQNPRQFPENIDEDTFKEDQESGVIMEENVTEESCKVQKEGKDNIIFQESVDNILDENVKDFSTSRSLVETTPEITENNSDCKDSIECKLDPNEPDETFENIEEGPTAKCDDDVKQDQCVFSNLASSSTQDFLDMERRALLEESLDQHPAVDDSNDEKKDLLVTVVDPEEKPAPICQDTEIEQNIQNEQNLQNFQDHQSLVNQQDHVELIEQSTTSDTVAINSTLENSEMLLFDTSVSAEEIEEKNESESRLDSWVTVEQAIEQTAELKEGKKFDEEEVESTPRPDESIADESPRAPLATSDDETSDISNPCDSESREETITTSTVTSSSTKGGTKTKKKKIEGVAGNDASPNLTPRTKKTKKSKKSELEKENISVNSNLQDPSMRTGSNQMQSEIELSENDLSNVNVKSLTQNYVSEACRSDHERSCKERIATGVSIKQLCRSFGDISNMTDADQTSTLGKSNHTMESDEKARSMSDLRVCERNYSRFTKDAPVFVGVSVKALRASYCSLASVTREGKDTKRAFEGSRLEKSSFNKFDALSKKSVLHVRSVDAAKVQQQLNAVGQNGDTNPTCRSCGKVVFQMEQTKAEGLVWHKNCFRCVQCSKQLNVDNYESHESTLYCKPHFKELFQPKPVEESEQPMRPRKPEMIIRENEPKELPPDVVRASDKPDLGLEELSSLNVKSRFQVFEKAGTENTNEIERSPSQVAVKRSPSILSKLAKFQAKGMDIGVADESLNGIPYEESSESEEEVETEETEEVENEIVKAKRATRERPISFSKMDDIKNRWETTSQQGRREVQREARKEEIAGIRSRLFMGKQGKMKEMYQQAVAGSERVTKINAAEEIQHSTHARSIKERFERGEPIAASDDETDGKPKPEKADEEVIAAGIGRKSRSLFLELDASAAKSGRPVTPVNPKTPADTPRRARDAFMGRQVSDDVVRSSDRTEEVQVETSDISNKFKFFESYKEPEKQRKQFRITPPRDGQVKMDSPDREIYRDPDVVRADDRVDEVVRTDTARKMLSIFRQMEENATKEEVPEGPKPLKRFTPPPEDKFAKATASDSEEEEEEDGEESEGEESTEERDPNYVRASDKVEDEFLKQAQNAARAKTLRAKFEHWEETDGKTTSHNVAEMELAQSTGDQSSIESASSLRARFESLGSQTSESPRTPKVKVHRFVEIQTTCTDVCESCEKKVYPLEKVETNNKIFHKQCFRCLQCNCVLRMDTFTLNNGKLYCIPHFKQLFITRGNYDEGFGVDPHKNKWATGSTNPTASSPIAVSNGEL